MNLKSLPDVNVWLALALQAHPHNPAAKHWFQTLDENDRLFFCRISQTGFLRLLTAITSPDAGPLTQAQAWRVYDAIVRDPRISLTDEPIEINAAFRRVSSRDEASPKRWTDDYFIAFAEASGLTLVTFDRVLASRTGGGILLTP
jgi:uncharacterized protein